ncbi:MAG: response regulator [Spirochaetaceae bacterium]|nr:MAG: response regulator [Spirochaetaceae bacterium]
MSWNGFVYLIPYIISAAISCWIVLYAWRRRQVAGGGAYAAYALFAALYSVGFILELISTTVEAKIFWDNVQFIPAFGIPVALFVFARQYTGNRSAHPYRLWILLFVLPFVSLVLVFTDSLHGLIRPAAWLVPGQPFSALVYDFTIAMWAMALYAYALTVASIICLFVRFFRSQRLYRMQVAIVSIGVLLPVAGSIFTLLGLAPTFHRDMVPITFAVGHLIVAWGLFRYRLLDIVPIARNTVVEAMADAVLVLDAQNRVADLNPAAERLIDLPSSKAIGQPAGQVLSTFEHLFDRIRNIEQAHEQITVGSGKNQRIFELTILPLRDRSGRLTGRLIMAHDISEREHSLSELNRYRDNLERIVEERTAELKREIEERTNLETQLRQSQKIEAIGTLAGGVAHDFNNLLTTILGYADMLLSDEDLTKAAKAGIMEIQKSAVRASSLTKQLLAFSRKQILEPRVIDLNRLLRQRAKMLERLVGENVELMFRLGRDTGRILADPGSIEQVVVNLVANARDAMPTGGTCTLETQKMSPDECVEIGNPELTEREYVLFSVSDTGSGMDEKTRQHVFEPFFTTKEVGKGIGLGLSSVYGIIKQSGGAIEVESTPRKGSIFRVYLPCTQREEKSAESASGEANAERGTETILLVEDETALRKITARALEQYGYRVVSAGNGEEALEFAKTSNLQGIDLLLTDVVMPRMNGRELADRLHDTYPELKILYVTGYSDDVIVHHGVLDEGINVLQKPFTTITLTKKVRQVLNS